MLCYVMLCCYAMLTFAISLSTCSMCLRRSSLVERSGDSSRGSLGMVGEMASTCGVYVDSCGDTEQWDSAGWCVDVGCVWVWNREGGDMGRVGHVLWLLYINTFFRYILSLLNTIENFHKLSIKRFFSQVKAWLLRPINKQLKSLLRHYFFDRPLTHTHTPCYCGCCLRCQWQEGRGCQAWRPAWSVCWSPWWCWQPGSCWAREASYPSVVKRKAWWKEQRRRGEEELVSVVVLSLSLTLISVTLCLWCYSSMVRPPPPPPPSLPSSPSPPPAVDWCELCCYLNLMLSQDYFTSIRQIDTLFTVKTRRKNFTSWVCLRWISCVSEWVWIMFLYRKDVLTLL